MSPIREWPNARCLTILSCCASPNAHRVDAVYGLQNSRVLGWRPNPGAALYATGWTSKGSPLLHVSLAGETHLLYTGNYYLESPVASPNGKLLAFGDTMVEGNVWVMEDPRR